MDIFGKALQDFYQSADPAKLWLHNNYGKPEDMPIDVFFRAEDEISELEGNALDLCQGKILDVGAGVGAHSLILQSRGLDVTSVEISEGACQIMKSRGIKNVVHGDIFSSQGKYDTLLMLMNGIGLCGDVSGLNVLLPHLKHCLNNNGQILLDSSDISYLYDKSNFPKQNYFGEISYQYEYKSEMGPWFKWLYVDFELLKSTAALHGYSCVLLYEDDMDQYLARLSPIR